MNGLFEGIAELAALTQLYLWQNFPLDTPRRQLKGAATPTPQPATKPTPPALTTNVSTPLPQPQAQSAPPQQPLAPRTSRPIKPIEKAIAPPPPPSSAKPQKIKGFTLSTPAAVLPSVDSELLNLLGEIAPKQILTDEPKAMAIEAPIALLTFDEQGKEALFLENLSRAIAIALKHPCQQVPAKLWPSLKKKTKGLRLLIASAARLSATEELAQSYQEDAKQAIAWMDELPLLLLPDLSLQMSQPHLKAALWETIRQTIKRYVH